MTAEGAAFPTPDGCLGSPVDTVTTVSESDLRGEATWTRVETTDCVDRYDPQGVATELSPEVPDWCASATYSETSGAITPDDWAVLRIDRSTNPPRVSMFGDSAWETDRTCTYPDGTTETERVVIAGSWAEGLRMAFDGDRFSGALDIDAPPASWSFTLR